MNFGCRLFMQLLWVGRVDKEYLRNRRPFHWKAHWSSIENWRPLAWRFFLSSQWAELWWRVSLGGSALLFWYLVAFNISSSPPLTLCWVQYSRQPVQLIQPGREQSSESFVWNRIPGIGFSNPLGQRRRGAGFPEEADKGLEKISCQPWKETLPPCHSLHWAETDEWRGVIVSIGDGYQAEQHRRRKVERSEVAWTTSVATT